MKKFMESQTDQGMLMPVYLPEWLPANHEIFWLSTTVDQLDLSAIYVKYQGGGRPAYDPRMMVKVLCYAYMRGVRSSRRIERMLWEDIPMRVLSGNQQPDHWTIAHFRHEHQQELGQLFVQTVRVAVRAGAANLKHVAVDGTKIKANASKHRAMSYKRMVEEETRLDEEIKTYLREAKEVDAEEDRTYGDRRPGQVPKELAEPQKRLEAIRKAKAELEEEARQQAEEERKAREQAGQKPRRKEKEAKPKAKAQRNFTDSESRIMKSSSEGFVQGFNGQVAVDAKNQIIVAADLTNQAADSPHPLGLVDQTKANTGRLPEETSADAGYYSQQNVDGLEERNIEALIPPVKIRHMHWRTAKAPRGRPPKNLSARDRMMRKLLTKKGKERYKLRQITVEPVFGQIKGNRGFRQLLMRGLDAARASWQFECAVHNLLKLHTLGVVPV